MKNKAFILITLLAMVAIGGGVWVYNQSSQDEVGPPPMASANSLPDSKPAIDPVTVTDPNVWVRPHSMTYGKADAKVTVVEFFDPECETCKIMHPLTKSLVKEYGNRVRFAHRVMPYHKESRLAACALEEARVHKKYDQALDILFERQPIWGSHTNPRPELISVYLQELGIPKNKLTPEYLFEKHGAKIDQDKADGDTVGVTGTPEFYINHHLLTELGEEGLRAMIEAALHE